MAFDVAVRNKGEGHQTIRRPAGGRGELASTPVAARFSLFNWRR